MTAAETRRWSAVVEWVGSLDDAEGPLDALMEALLDAGLTDVGIAAGPAEDTSQPLLLDGPQMHPCPACEGRGSDPCYSDDTDTHCLCWQSFDAPCCRCGDDDDGNVHPKCWHYRHEDTP